MDLDICSVIILLILLLILTGYLKRNDSDGTVIEMKEGYSSPPGMLPSLPVQDYYCHPPYIASPSKEWLKWRCGPSMVCHENPDCYNGWSGAPLDFRGSTASSVSNFIERSA